MNYKKLFGTLAAIFLGLIFLFSVNHTDKAAAAISFVASVFFPIFLGLGIAFVINIPVCAIEKLVLKIYKKKLTENGQKCLRVFSINLSYFLIAAVLAVVIFMVVPEMSRSFGKLTESLGGVPQKLAEKRGFIEEISGTLAYYVFDYDKEALVEKAANWMMTGSSDALGYAFSIVRSAAAFVYYIVVSLITSVSVLKKKEKIAAQIKKLMAAYLDPQRSLKILTELEKVKKVFSSFIAGQCLEAVILGTMFAVSMAILRLPYALMVGSLIAVTALVPIFGAFVGLAVGAIVIAVESPIKALWFIILFFVLQQIEGNLIYPKVVGGSVGLSPLWTLLAVFIGGDMCGIMGMIFFVPIFSCIYSLLSRFANARLSKMTDEQKQGLL